jgi:primase-polymerase (primpol)-like protein
MDVESNNLSDGEVLRLLTAVDRGAPKWRTVLDVEWGEHYISQSDADCAIAGKLAFYSGG